jgi:predicted nucleic acid-binding protein
LPGHFRPTTEEFDRMWEEGMFVVDTNVLLNLYRYSRSTRDELLRVLRALENKLFLPHQVGREFLERRLEIVRKQREGFSNLRQRVTGVRREMETELRKVLRLRPGEDLPDGLRNALEEVPLSGYGVLSGRLEALETDLPQPSNSPDDTRYGRPLRS